MLAFPTKSITKVLHRVEGHKFICEFKYDGERAQVNNLMIIIFIFLHCMDMDR